MRTLLSLFDYSGQWSDPFRNGGWNVIQWDIKLSDLMDINILQDAETCLEMFENVDGIIAAVPCTDFTNSGAQYWPLKDENGKTVESLELVYQVQRLADLFTPTDPEYDGTFFWSIENPVGRLSKLVPELGQPYYFNPWEFAGYTNPTTNDLKKLDFLRLKKGNGVTSDELDFILKTNAYSKKTGLWGEFNRNLKKKPIEPVKASAQGTYTQRFGGKSDKTKELRSNTPIGFAQAFYEANKNHQCHLQDDYSQLNLFEG